MGRASLLLILYIFTGTVGVLCKRPIKRHVVVKPYHVTYITSIKRLRSKRRCDLR